MATKILNSDYDSSKESGDFKNQNITLYSHISNKAKNESKTDKNVLKIEEQYQNEDDIIVEDDNMMVSDKEISEESQHKETSIAEVPTPQKPKPAYEDELDYEEDVISKFLDFLL